MQRSSRTSVPKCFAATFLLKIDHHSKQDKLLITWGLLRHPDIDIRFSDFKWEKQHAHSFVCQYLLISILVSWAAPTMDGAKFCSMCQKQLRSGFSGCRGSFPPESNMQRTEAVAATCQHVENGRSLPREYQKSRKTRSWKEERTEGKKQKRVRATSSVLQPSSLQQAKERRHILPETDNVTFMHQEDEAQLEMPAATSI